MLSRPRIHAPLRPRRNPDPFQSVRHLNNVWPPNTHSAYTAYLRMQSKEQAMKGVVMNLLADMVETQLGMQEWNDVLDEAGEDGVYTATSLYEDERLLNLSGHH